MYCGRVISGLRALTQSPELQLRENPIYARTLILDATQNGTSIFSKCRFDHFLLRRRAVTPAGSAALTVRADTHATDHGSGTSRGATRPTATGEGSGRQF